MQNLIRRARRALTRTLTVLKAAPTWITATSGAVVFFSDEIVDVLPNGWDSTASEIVASTLAVLAGARATVRRVTPVVKDLRGLLPPADS